MIDARIDGDSLAVVATGLDWWPYYTKQTRLAPRLSVRLPLEHITAARAARPRKHPMHMNVPAGGKRNGSGTLVWCKRAVPVLELDMDGQPYKHVVLSLPDPERLAEQIRQAARVGER
jgi:hypothetical protein